MLGKEFIIVLVIFFSGLSFTLGYFVGKSGAPKTEPIIQAVEPPIQAKNQDLPPLPQQAAVAPVPEQAQPAPPAVKEQAATITPAADQPVQRKTAEPPVSKAVPEKSTAKTRPDAASETSKAVYTVQIGAFSNLAEAKRLKAKFDRKGYKSVITSSINKKAQKIFKVKTGEFREKKDAEVLALKLKKTEGLQTYVTLRTE